MIFCSFFFSSPTHTIISIKYLTIFSMSLPLLHSLVKKTNTPTTITTTTRTPSTTKMTSTTTLPINSVNHNKCSTLACPFFGTREQNNQCSHCSGRIRPARQEHLSEDEALTALVLTREIFPTKEEFDERILWMTKTRQISFMGSDNHHSVQLAREFIGLGLTKPLSVEQALRIWREVVLPRGLNELAFQKALVVDTFAPWLLPLSDFSVGRCYFGTFDYGPKLPRHAKNFVHLPEAIRKELSM